MLRSDPHPMESPPVLTHDDRVAGGRGGQSGRGSVRGKRNGTDVALGHDTDQILADSSLLERHHSFHAGIEARARMNDALENEQFVEAGSRQSNDAVIGKGVTRQRRHREVLRRGR